MQLLTLVDEMLIQAIGSPRWNKLNRAIVHACKAACTAAPTCMKIPDEIILILGKLPHNIVLLFNMNIFFAGQHATGTFKWWRGGFI